MDNADLHRFVIRGSTHKRARPNNSRFIGGSITNSLTKRSAKGGSGGENNWIGRTWMKEYNNWDGDIFS